MTQEDQEALRWGVVGASVISRQMVADFALVPGATVSAVVSRDAARAAAFADEFGIAASYSRRHDMFASDVDAVYIATPHVTHFDIASEAIAAGKHVLCEKPLGMNEREVRELAARAAHAGVFLMEAMWMKFNPLYARLSQLIADGVLGDVRSVRAAFRAGTTTVTDASASSSRSLLPASIRCSSGSLRRRRRGRYRPSSHRPGAEHQPILAGPQPA